MTTEATIYIGTPEALQAEIGLLPCYVAKYVVAAFLADGTQVEPELADDAAEADAFAAEISAWLKSEGHTVNTCWVA